MNEQQSVKVVQDAYAAFGREDIGSILNALTEDVDWQSLGPDDLPMGGLRRGRPEVARFFE